MSEIACNDDLKKSSDDLKIAIYAIAISGLFIEMKKNCPDNYRSFKANLKVTSKALMDISNAVEDDIITSEELKDVLKDMTDPYVRALIDMIFRSCGLTNPFK